MWLFQHLKSSASGANRSQYEYLSYVRILNPLLGMLQQDNKSTEGISKSIKYVLLNLNMVGGNMYPEKCQVNEKFINPSGSDEATAVIVENKITGNLITKSENYKEYGDLNISLINSMTQGHNCYHNRKATK